jgi:hypothetical protein
MRYYARGIFRRLRMESYSARQRWWVYVQDKIYAQLAAHANDEGGHARWEVSMPRKLPSHLERVIDPATGRRHTVERQDPHRRVKSRLLILLGDGTFRHNSAGHLTMPGGHRLFRELRRLGEHIRWIDEFRTSKCCSSCGNAEMEQAILVKRPKEPVRQARPGRVARQSRQRDKWVANRATVPSPVPVSSQANFSDPSFDPAYLLTPLGERVVRKRKPASISSDRLVARVRQGSPEHRASAYAPSCLYESWGLRHCSACNRLWCRDVNACRNMTSRALWCLFQPAPPDPTVIAPFRRKPDGPAYLRRGLPISPAKGNQIGHEPPMNAILPVRTNSARIVD